jgi:DNA-binding XRE family transcriptional regulator
MYIPSLTLQIENIEGVSYVTYDTPSFVPPPLTKSVLKNNLEEKVSIYENFMYICAMEKHTIKDYDLVLDEKFGKQGSGAREQALENARTFYTGQILHDVRKEAKMTQSQLAEKINVTKSYISRLENGGVVPSASMFYRIIDALGMKIEIVRQSVTA